jgi:hypothetical protein
MASISSEDTNRLQQSLAKDGYIIIRDVVPKSKLSEFQASVMAEFERLKGSGQLFTGGGMISGHLNCNPGEQSRFAYEALREQGIVDLIAALAPQSVAAVRAGCNVNLPNSVPQHYHMDGVYLEDFWIANVAVVDTDLVNGAIDVLPGTHQKFYKYWQFAVERTYRSSTRVPLQQGDVLLRTSRLWHRGMPNRAGVARPMLALTFGEKGAPKGDPFRINDGKLTFEPNWYNTNALGRLRERTFVKAPITYAAYRFARSLVGNKGYAS